MIFWSGAGVGAGMLRGRGTIHLIILDLEVCQDSTIVNAGFSPKPAKAQSIGRYQNFKIIHQKVNTFSIFVL